MLLSEAIFYIPHFNNFFLSPQHFVVWFLRFGFPLALTTSKASCHSASLSTLVGWALSSACWAGPFLPVAPQSPPPHLALTRTTIAFTTPKREVATRQRSPPPIMPRAPTSEMGEILTPKWMCRGL